MVKILLVIIFTTFQFFVFPKAIFASSCTIPGTVLNEDHTLRVYASSLTPNTSYTVALSGAFVDRTSNDRPVAGSAVNSDASGGWDNNVPILSINVTDGKDYSVALISSSGDRCDIGSFTYKDVVTPPPAISCEITSIKGQGTPPADPRIGEPLLISANKLEAGGTYSVILDENETGQRIKIPSSTSTYTATVTIPTRITTDPGEFIYISPGNHTLQLHHTTDVNDRCTAPVNLKAQKLSSCTVSHTTSPASDPSGFYVNVQGNSLYTNTNHEIRFDGARMDFAKSDSSGVINYTFKVTASGTVAVSLVPAEGTTAGYYECIANPNPFTITITPPAFPPAAPIPPTPPCAGSGCVKGGGIPCDDPTKGPGIQTAIGCIHTNPAEFVQDFMKFALGISGGFSFLLILMGAFQMMRSAGNPDSLQAGRDRLTSAVIGLLFIIFALLLLKVIGVSILCIPGFETC